MWAHGFRDSFTPLEGVLFTFPSRYSFAIGLTGVFSLAGWSRRIRAGLHVPRVTQDANRPRRASRTGLSPSMVGLSRRVPLAPGVPSHGPTTPGTRTSTTPGLGCSPVARHYWGNHCCFLFLRVLRCFSSPRWPPRRKARMAGLQPAGLSHSETRGSKVICTYPRIIAAYRVLRRLREPRHPPCAFRNFRRCATQFHSEARSYFQLSRHAHKKRASRKFVSCSLQFRYCRNMSKIVRGPVPTGVGPGLSRLCVGNGLAFAHPRPTGVENNGFEPLTPCLQSRCSSQLS